MKKQRRLFALFIRLLLVVALLLLIVGAWVLFNKSEKHPPTKAGRSVPGVSVVAVAAKKGDFPVYITGLGTVTPVYTVTVRTRVDGELMEVHCQDRPFLVDWYIDIRACA